MATGALGVALTPHGLLSQRVQPSLNATAIQSADDVMGYKSVAHPHEYLIFRGTGTMAPHGHDHPCDGQCTLPQMGCGMDPIRDLAAYDDGPPNGQRHDLLRTIGWRMVLSQAMLQPPWPQMDSCARRPSARRDGWGSMGAHRPTEWTSLIRWALPPASPMVHHLLP